MVPPRRKERGSRSGIFTDGATGSEEAAHSGTTLGMDIRAFVIEPFSIESDEWEYWIKRFKIALKASKIVDSERMRDYLFAKLGTKSFKILVDFFSPKEVEEIPFDDLVAVLEKHYGRGDTSLSERLKFARVERDESESIAEFSLRLHSQASKCRFGVSLNERLRDQMLFGLQNSAWQQEILKQYPTVESTLEDVEKLCRILEQAKLQQERISENTRILLTRNIKGLKHSEVGRNCRTRVMELVPGKHCFKCGGTVHRDKNTCPALGEECRECKGRNHFASVCLKSMNVKVKKIMSTRHTKTARSESSESGDTSDSERKTNIRRMEKGSEVLVDVVINGKHIEMLFDTGAAKTVVSEKVWKEIGAPELRKSSSLLAYTGVKVDTLGKAKVKVQAFGRTLKLPVVVTKQEDIPLFGMDWVLAFGVPLPQETRIRKLSKQESEMKENDSEVRQVLNKFKRVFEPGTGTISTHKVAIHLKENAIPRVFKPRRVPFGLQTQVEDELNRLMEQGIIEEVDATKTPIEWASAMVVATKANGELRLCSDFKVTLNKYVYTDPHPLPTFDDLIAKLAGGQRFSVIDLKDAYLQLEVEEKSRRYLVIATHKGYFRYKRLPFGICFAPCLFQRVMETILAGIPGVANYIDDIIVTGGTKEEHVRRLEQVLQRLEDAGVRAQPDKCKWFQEEVKYMGHMINCTGVHPTQERLEAISKMPTPRNQKELRSFLGAINYYGSFIPNLQGECSTLHHLLAKQTKWEWGDVETQAFNRVKELLVSANSLSHYDKALPLVVTTDASDRGLGAVLFHKYPDGLERPIVFASRTLKMAEKRYSAIDKETLGIIFAVTKFRQYLYGRHFTLRTDHKPLVHLLGESQEIPKMAANRLTRWAIILAAFDYDIEHQSGSRNAPADVLSRLPIDSTEGSVEEEEGITYGRRLNLIRLEDVAVSRKLLKEELAKDHTLARVTTLLESGWPQSKLELSQELHTFYEKKEELSKEDNMLLWRGRLVIPVRLRPHVLNTLHEGHPGISGMRAVARTHVYWPNMDKDIEGHVQRCTWCQATRPVEMEVPLYSWTVPPEPWTRIHVDFCGPFQGKMWFLVVDATSKWLEIFPMERTTTEKTISFLRETFTRFGLPRCLVSDNGPQFISREFKEFCEGNNITHIKSTPYHPKTNGLAEREVRTFKPRMKALSEIRDIGLRLQTFLMSYRITPQKTTGRSPAEMMFGRNIKTRLDLLKPCAASYIDTSVVKQKLVHDRKAKAKEFEEDQDVWVLNTTGRGYVKGRVLKRLGLYSYLVDIEGVQRRKHAEQLRHRIGQTDAGPETTR